MQDFDWDAMAAPWLRAAPALERTHGTVLDGLIRRARLEEGQRVLDIGFGTGASLVAAAEAVGKTGHVTGVDISPPLAERARERVPPTVEIVVGDAGAMEYDRAHDAAISLFGTMFFRDTAAAFATIRKAVRPGARFVFAAWGAPQRTPWFGIQRAAAEARLGPLPARDPAAPGPFRFADAAATASLVGAAGWDVTVETEALVLGTGETPESLAELHLDIARVNLLAGHDLSEADIDAIRAKLREGFAPFRTGAAVQLPAEVHFYTATATG